MKRMISAVATLLLVGVVCGYAQAGFVKVDDILGSSIDNNHKNWSDIQSMTWGTNTAFSIGGAGAGGGQTSFDGVSFTMKMDRACTEFYDLQVRGRSSDSLTIDLEDISQKTNAVYTYYRIKLKDVFFVEHLTSWDPTAGPVETFTVKFVKITVQHFIVNAKGVTTKSGEFTWNLAQNAP